MGTRHTLSARRDAISITVIALVLAALACNLTGDDQPKGAPTAPSLTTGTITFIPPTNPFRLETATPYPTPVPTQAPSTPTPIPCTPYVTWPQYVVQAGDTLSQIAEATGTTVAQLSVANCLLDADLIAVGDVLYVPRLPVPPTPTPTNTPFATVDVLAPRFDPNLTADRHWIDPDTGQPTTYHPTVRVDLGEVYNADRVDFYVNDPAGGPVVPIGSDDSPWDGAFVDYDFPAAGSYTFGAFVINTDRTVKSNVFTVIYDPDFVPPEGRYDVLIIEPNAYFDGTQYILNVGAVVTIWWQNAPIGALGVNFYMQPYAPGQQPIPQLIGSDNTLTDGASISWHVPSNLYGYVFGRATMPDGSTIESQNMTVVSDDQ